MAKEYLKMADVFFKHVEPCDFSLKTASVSVYRDDGVSPHEYAAHAINSHDELVAEVERLREHNKNIREAINRMSNVIWGNLKDMDCFLRGGVAMTREEFIEQYCHFPHPEQK